MMMKAAAFLLVVLALGAAPALGNGLPFVVNTTADDHDSSSADGICQTSTPGVCTLRAAVEQANASGGAIIRVPAGTYAMSLGELLVSSTTEIQGAGAASTVIVAGGGERILRVTGTDTSPKTLFLWDLTLRDADLDFASGAAIYVAPYGAARLWRCMITNCKAWLGGGIYAQGPVSAYDTVFSSCRATNNPFTGHGGAIYFANALVVVSAELERCTFNNNVTLGEGAAICLTSSYGPVTIRNSTFSYNHSGSYGGAIRVQGSAMWLEHVTITGNNSDAVAGGGGISHAGVSADVQIWNSILAGNYDVVKAGDFTIEVPGECSGAFTSHACTVVGPDATPHCTFTGIPTPATPLLGPLQNNGGHTPTQALLLGSPGIEWATCNVGTPPATDQRGVTRPIADQADSGAYERAPCGDVNGDGVVNVADVLFLINHLFAGGPVPPGLADVNQDAARNVADVLFLINRLFAGGPAPTCPGT